MADTELEQTQTQGITITRGERQGLHGREELETSMEAIIHHFKLFTEGYSPPPGDVYVAVESGRGENGCYIVSDGMHKPRRVEFRSASLVNQQALEHMSVGSMLADFIAIIGTAGTVLGDCDR